MKRNKFDLILGTYERCFVPSCRRAVEGKADVHGLKADGRRGFKARIWTCAAHQDSIDRNLAELTGMPVLSHHDPNPSELFDD